MSPKYHKQTEARELRGNGLSLKEIAEKLNVSKSSASRWCSDIKLTTTQKRKLENKQQEAALKGRKRAAKLKRERKKKRINKSKNKGRDRVGQVTKRDRYIAGLMLYSGEGDKKDGRVAVSNTNPKIITFMAKWFEEFFDVRPDSLKAELYIHDNLDVEKAINFWSENTRIPAKNFLEPYVVEDKPNKHRKNKHKFGVIKIRFHDCDVHREIIGSVESILEDS